MFCRLSAGVVETVYCTGTRMRSVLPILAPLLAKLSSYWRFTAPMMLHFWCRIASALAVIMLMVRRVFDSGHIGLLLTTDCGRRGPFQGRAGLVSVVAGES